MTLFALNYLTFIRWWGTVKLILLILLTETKHFRIWNMSKPALRNRISKARRTLSDKQKKDNKLMAVQRIGVEWKFRDIVEEEKFIDCHKSNKIQLSQVGKSFLVAWLLENARNCLYGSSASTYWKPSPPTLEEYFGVIAEEEWNDEGLDKEEDAEQVDNWLIYLCWFISLSSSSSCKFLNVKYLLISPKSNWSEG